MISGLVLTTLLAVPLAEPIEVFKGERIAVLGNTLADDEAARYGLFDEASPGWAEFDPYEGYDDMFGGNWT